MPSSLTYARKTRHTRLDVRAISTQHRQVQLRDNTVHCLLHRHQTFRVDAGNVILRRRFRLLADLVQSKRDFSYAGRILELGRNAVPLSISAGDAVELLVQRRLRGDDYCGYLQT